MTRAWKRKLLSGGGADTPDMLNHVLTCILVFVTIFVSVSSYGTNVVNAASIVSKIPVGLYPIGILYDPGNHDIYVANSLSNTVYVINGATNTVVKHILVGTAPYQLAYDSNNGNIYVTNSHSNDVYVIDGSTNSVTKAIPVGKSPQGIAVDIATNEIYVANNGSNNVSVIDGATNSFMMNISVGDHPLSIAYDAGNGGIYLTNTVSHSISVINGATNKMVGGIPIFGRFPTSFPLGIIYDPANGNLYTSSVENVFVINDGRNEVTGTIGLHDKGPVCYPPRCVEPTYFAYDSANGNIYVLNDSDKSAFPNSVYTISGATNTLVGSPIPVGKNPSGIAYDEANNNIYVANTGSFDVYVIHP